MAFAGGSAGGTDQILVGLLAKAAGVDPPKPNTSPTRAAARRAPAILSGAVDAGVCGVSEFADQVEAGEMRFLAVSSGEAIEVGGESAPTLRSGPRRGARQLARRRRPAGHHDADRDRIIVAMEELHATPSWKDQLERNDWTTSSFRRRRSRRSSWRERTPGRGSSSRSAWWRPSSEADRGTADAETSRRGRARGAGRPRLAGVALLLAGILVRGAGTTVRSAAPATSRERTAVRRRSAVGGPARAARRAAARPAVVRPDTEHAELGGGGAGDPPADRLAALAVALAAIAYVAAVSRSASSCHHAVPPVVARGCWGAARSCATRVGLGIAVVVYLAFTEYLGVPPAAPAS